jgi:hypothetical protein
VSVPGAQYLPPLPKALLALFTPPHTVNHFTAAPYCRVVRPTTRRIGGASRFRGSNGGFSKETIAIIQKQAGLL